MRFSMLAIISLVVVLTGCSTLTGTKRTFTFAVAGGATGAVGGAVLSPNPESRALNALVFGLVGSLVGGISGIATDRPLSAPSEKPDSLIEEGTGLNSRTSVVAPYETLPDYVKKRLQPIVIEEFVEADQVDEDGVLRESHKAYRIKRQPEFNPRPLSSNSSDKKAVKK